MVTTAGLIRIPKYMETLVKANLIINEEKPNEFYVLNGRMKKSLPTKLNKIRTFVESHGGSYELVTLSVFIPMDSDELISGACIKIYGNVSCLFETILNQKQEEEIN